jgi:hypothetical protein
MDPMKCKLVDLGVCHVFVFNSNEGFSFILGGTMKNNKGITNDVPTPDERESLRSVYILTLPAFTWVKAPNPDPTWRSQHACENLNGRQMLVVGGIQEDLPQATEPRPNSLGIYDMINLNWTDTYDPNVQPYIPATIIQDVYTKTSGQPSIWGDPALPGIFKVKAIEPPSSSTSTISTPTASPTAASTSTTPPRPAEPQTNLTTIILASTLSAIFLISLILILAVYLCKRSIAFRNAEIEIAALANSKSSSVTSVSTTEKDSLPAEVHADMIWTEMLTTANYHEVADSGFVPVWEMDGAQKQRALKSKQWITTSNRIDSPSVYSVDERQGGIASFSSKASSVISPSLRSPVLPSPVVASPSVKSIRSIRAPSIRSNVQDSLEWRRDMYDERPRVRMPVPIPIPPRPVLSLVTHGDWI